MSIEAHHEPYVIMQLPADMDPTKLVPPKAAPAPPQAHLLQDPEQTKAVEALFSAQERESDTVMGVLGVWAGAALLSDLAMDAFKDTTDEDEPKEKKKPLLEE